MINKGLREPANVTKTTFSGKYKINLHTNF